jgi:hypothetical protein
MKKEFKTKKTRKTKTKTSIIPAGLSSRILFLFV